MFQFYSPKHSKGASASLQFLWNGCWIKHSCRPAEDDGWSTKTTKSTGGHPASSLSCHFACQQSQMAHQFPHLPKLAFLQLWLCCLGCGHHLSLQVTKTVTNTSIFHLHLSFLELPLKDTSYATSPPQTCHLPCTKGWRPAPAQRCLCRCSHPLRSYELCLCEKLEKLLALSLRNVVCKQLYRRGSSVGVAKVILMAGFKFAQGKEFFKGDALFAIG